ncbi:MAG: hypothetical protein ACPGWM_09175 [Flavobacteriales bacterium]
MDQEISSFKVEGKLACWKFIENSKNYPGWNFCVDDLGRASLVALIEKMLASKWPSKKEVQTFEPLELNQRWILETGTYSSVKSIVLESKKEPTHFWKLNAEKGILTISVGSDNLVKLKDALVNEIFDDGLQGDFEGEGLWFW